MSKKNWVVVKWGVGAWTASLRSVVAKATPSFRRNKVAPQKKCWNWVLGVSKGLD